MNTYQDYGAEKVEVQTKPPAKKIPASADWPRGWKPLTEETYRKVIAWRRDRSREKGMPNYTPTLATHLAFDVREFPISDSGCRIGFPYKLDGLIENIKVLEIQVDPIIQGDETIDYAAAKTKDKKGKLSIQRKIWLLEDSTPRNMGVLFGADKYLGPNATYGLNELDPTIVDRAGDEEYPAVPVGDMHITEGEWDAMCLWEQSYSAMSVLNAGQTADLEPAILEMLGWYDNIWLDLDNDKPGRECQDRLLKVLPNAKVVRFSPCKDACEYYARGGAQALRDFIDAETARMRGSISTVAVAKVDDWTDKVLDGWLGEVCKRRMLKDFPISYAWTALLTVAGAMVPPAGDRTNLYACLVGEPHSGKTKAQNRAIQVLGLRPDLRNTDQDIYGDGQVTDAQHEEQYGDVLVAEKIGSAEGLAMCIGDAGHAHRLWYPGELRHTLGKAMIQSASFPSVLCDAFDEDVNNLTIEKQKHIPFSCQLSVLGGLPEDGFSTVFGAESIGGLYDRFIFGHCPTDFRLAWLELSVSPEALPKLQAVEVTQEAGRAMLMWAEENGINDRIALLALHAATICASFNGKTNVGIDDLAPHKAFALEQKKARLILKPNTGETTEGKLTDSLRSYLARYSPQGEWVSVKKMYDSTNAYKLGVTIAERILKVLEREGVVEFRITATAGRKSHQVRRVVGAKD